MPARFTVLASGSSGNASLLEVDGFGILLDAGLGPRQLNSRMAAVGRSWAHVHAVLLTHTHGDHWNERTLAHLRRRLLPLHCHPSHHTALLGCGWEFAKLHAGRLVRTYDGPFELGPGIRCQPLPLSHDSGPTFGFRFDGPGGPGGPAWSLGYVADLGTWTPELARALADVDLLALEFNHDVELEYASGRPAQLVARVLGDDGHLSNEQAAALLACVLNLSVPGRLRHVVQLHLSRECNRPPLAREAAQAVLGRHAPEVCVHTAAQDRTLPVVELHAAAPAGATNGRRAARFTHSCFPGWDG